MGNQDKGPDDPEQTADKSIGNDPEESIDVQNDGDTADKAGPGATAHSSSIGSPQPELDPKVDDLVTDGNRTGTVVAFVERPVEGSEETQTVYSVRFDGDEGEVREHKRGEITVLQ